jgi:formylglycine-generating enzyme required for sulfatase activity
MQSRRDVLRTLAATIAAHTVPIASVVLAPIGVNLGFGQQSDPHSALNASVPPRNDEHARVIDAARRASAAIELLKRGSAEFAWPLLNFSDDPTSRSYLIHSFARLNVPATVLINRLRQGSNVGERHALILALGEFTNAGLPPSLRATILPTLLDWYRDDPHPGIHGAIDWLLRTPQTPVLPARPDWGAKTALTNIATRRAIDMRLDRQWYVTSAGYTMVILPANSTFVMGSPEYELKRFPDESLHPVKISRIFAIASTETTVDQFNAFLRDRPELKTRHDQEIASRFSRPQTLAPSGDSPIVGITWYEAAQYCNWLSGKEGIPESEWCFPNEKMLATGMTLPIDYLHRSGYRLLTEAEWEYAARAGTTTARYFGLAEDLTPKYVWFAENSKNKQTLPVGRLKPNDYGLFDMLGNAWEWCIDRRQDYPNGSSSAVDDHEDSQRAVTDTNARIRRGGSFTYNFPSVRAACRGDVSYFPQQRRDSVGFRIARTIKS